MTARSLVEWYRKNARVLPWRGEPRDPYEVVVSEFMLQQTQVDRVVPRFVEFVDRFPDLGRLAAASEEEVPTAQGAAGRRSHSQCYWQLGLVPASTGANW